MTAIEIIEEERDRLMAYVLQKKGIRSVTSLFDEPDPIREVMRQARSIRGYGIFDKIGKSPRLASKLLNVPLTARKWSRSDIGKVKSLRSRRGNLKKLAYTLGRTPNSVYKLIGRLKVKGEVK